MPKPTRNYRPLTDVGVDFSVPQYQRKWQRLDNTYPEGGNIRKRPGVRIMGPQDRSAYNLGIPVAVLEFDGQDETWSSEVIRPDGTDSAGSWTVTGAASVHLAIDETDLGDSDGDYVSSSTDDDTFTVTFGNPSGTYQRVSGVIIYGRARIEGDSNTRAVLKIHFNDGTSDYLIDSVTITANRAAEADTWENFAVTSAYNPKDGSPWTKADMSNLRISVEREDASKGAVALLAPDADGTDTGWDSGDYTDVQRFANYFLAGTTGDDYIEGSTSGTRQGLAFSGPSFTFSSIDSVQIHALLDLQDVGSGSPPVIRVYQRGTDATYRQIGSDLVVDRSRDYPTWSDFWGTNLFTVTLTQNPETSTAWTDADLDDLEIVLEIASTGNDRTVRCYTAGATVAGAMSGATVEFSTLQAELWGPNFTNGIEHLLIDHKGLESVDPDATSHADEGAAVTWSGMPDFKVPYAALNDKVWATNGTDDLIFWPDTGNVWGQLSSKPFGRAIASYGARIILGDVTESGTRNQERLRWSKVNDPTDWADSTAGNRDVHDTPGAWTNLTKMYGSLIGYKKRGIYEIIVRGDVVEPFRHFLRVENVGCLAGATVQSSVDNAGNDVHFFLGDGPEGLNVYMFNGQTAIPVGNPIQPKLKNELNQELKTASFAVVDPVTKMYMLFYPNKDSNEVAPDECWAYHIPTDTWRRWTFPLKISAAGVWTRPDLLGENEPWLNAPKRVVLAGVDGFTYWLDPDSHMDHESTKQPFYDNAAEASVPEVFTPGDNSDDTPPIVPIATKIETGDLFEPDASLSISAARVRVWYRNRGPARITAAASTDGGVTYTDEQTFDIASGMDPGVDGDESLSYLDFGWEVENAQRFSVQLRETFGDDLFEIMSAGDFEIEDMQVELDIGGQR